MLLKKANILQNGRCQIKTEQYFFKKEEDWEYMSKSLEKVSIFPDKVDELCLRKGRKKIGKIY